MTQHARRQILNAAALALTPEFTDVRVAPVYKVERLPPLAIVLIDWTTENVDYRHVMGTPLEQTRQLTVSVVLLRQRTDDVDLVSDVDAEVLERKLQHPTLDAKVDSWRLLSVAKQTDAIGEQPVARLSYLYEAIYRTRADAPGTILT